MASASAPAGELAVQRPAPASSLAVPSPAASTAEAVDLSAGAAVLEDPGPAAAAAAAASTRAGFVLGKKAESRDYMQQVSNFILSSYSLLALAFLLSGHKSQVFRVYVLSLIHI